jgi:hypothetical protein
MQRAAAPSSLIDPQGYQGGRGEEERGHVLQGAWARFPGMGGKQGSEMDKSEGNAQRSFPPRHLRETKDPQGL